MYENVKTEGAKAENPSLKRHSGGAQFAHLKKCGIKGAVGFRALSDGLRESSKQ